MNYKKHGMKVGGFTSVMHTTIPLGAGVSSSSAYDFRVSYKEKILHANDLCTMVTGKRLGHPVRSLRTPFARDYFKAEYSDISDEELERLGVGALKSAVIDGDNEKGCFLAGQIAAVVNKEQSAADIIKEVIEEAEPILKKAGELVE